MGSPVGESHTAHPHRRWIPLATLLVAVALAPGCKPGGKAADNATGDVTPPAISTSELIGQLAAARIDQAKIKLDQKRPDEALGLLVAALKVDPASVEARALAETILGETVWNLPILTLRHQLPIDQLACTAEGSLWVSLGGDVNTTVRWDLKAMQIESVLFPVNGVATRSLVFGPQGQSVVIERGPVTLLCNARTLKPIQDLGPLPDFVTPSATVVFSADGLLMAHPGFFPESDHAIVWHLRDVASGQILRSSDPAPAGAARPLAACLDRGKLRVLHSDGHLLEMPVSPVEPARTIPMPDPVSLLGAQFSMDGNSVLTLAGQGPHETPVQSIIAYQNQEDGSLELKPLTDRFPWSKHPNIWNGLMGDPETAPYLISGNSLKMSGGSHAPVEASREITAVAFEGDRVITGEQGGTVIVHRFLKLPEKRDAPEISAAVSQADLTHLRDLCESLSGVRYDEKERTFTRLDADTRFTAFGNCDLDAIHRIFPTLDFTGVREDIEKSHPLEAKPEAFLPVWDRLARADATGQTWPWILKLSSGLADNSWHRELASAVLARTPGHPAAETESTWLEGSRMEEIFRAGDESSILAAIGNAGKKGPAAASALSLALISDHPEWITACLESAAGLPSLVRQIALSRIAWLEGHRAIALSPWPESFPNMRDFRLREDWEGWEQADFEPALEKIRQCVIDELVAIEVPESSTPEQRKAVADRLADPETLATVGKPRFALACMNAALAFSAHNEDSETTFQLANTARNLGAPPEPCMRAEALALTAMGDFQKAHPIWIKLITEHPLDTQIPGDYAEAAYTAFENSNPQQAMTILTTGMHRYPEDANFALRAGWVALLTGNSERGYQFLKDGKRIGYPAEKEENAVALLTIAAAQCGSYDDATVYFNDLQRIDPAWGELQTLDTLEWPEELKSTLAQFMR